MLFSPDTNIGHMNERNTEDWMIAVENLQTTISIESFFFSFSLFGSSICKLVVSKWAFHFNNVNTPNGWMDFLVYVCVHTIWLNTLINKFLDNL